MSHRAILLLAAVVAATLLSAGEALGQEVGSDPVLVGAGDIASCGSTGDEATANLLDGIEGTVFTLGDNAYNKGTSAEFANCYDPTWGRHKARTKPSVGNHEYGTTNASGYFNYFGAAAGEPSKGYYSYDVGDWHVVVLNSICSKVGGCTKGSPQERWLRADLAAHPNSCTLAYFHFPLFSSGKHGNMPSMRPFWQALYEANADVVLSGHDHLYERFAPQNPNGAADPAGGIREFVVGTGGASYYPFETVQPNSEVRIANTDGVLKLTLGSARYYWEFVPVDGQTPTDSGSTLCHDAGAEASDDTNIDSGPSGIVNDASATFEFSYSETGASFECSLDGSTFDACTSPKEYPDLADGSHTFEVRAIDAAGNTDPTPASRAWVVDTAAPVTQPPAQSLATNSTLATSTVPIKFAWSATDDSGSGVVKYQLQRSTNGGAYTDETLSKATATSKTVSLSPGSAYQFRVRAMDRAGNFSEWTYGPQFFLDAHQETSEMTTYSGTWTQQADSSAYGGGLKYAGVKGHKAQFSFAGRNVAWVAPKDVNRGRAEVWVDGVKKKTIDLYSSAAQPRRAVYTQSWSTSGTHTLEVRVLGTKNTASSGTRVDVDAFVVLR
jgi:hypothetical protein